MLDEKDLQAIAQIMNALSQNMDKKVDALSQSVDEKLNAHTRQISLLLENEVTRKIDVLFDKVESIDERIKTLAPARRVEKLEEQVDLLSSVVKLHSREIDELKQAQ